uniref:Uncharacterized protein n=1 Tax=Cacopsylla melanoneura TaxID=428564 RepID=A0A8D8PXI5_9HEMI
MNAVEPNEVCNVLSTESVHFYPPQIYHFLHQAKITYLSNNVYLVLVTNPHYYSIFQFKSQPNQSPNLTLPISGLMLLTFLMCRYQHDYLIFISFLPIRTYYGLVKLLILFLLAVKHHKFSSTLYIINCMFIRYLPYVI